MELNRSIIIIHTGKGARRSEQCTQGPTGINRKQASINPWCWCLGPHEWIKNRAGQCTGALPSKVCSFNTLNPLLFWLEDYCSGSIIKGMEENVWRWEGNNIRREIIERKYMTWWRVGVGVHVGWGDKYMIRPSPSTQTTSSCHILHLSTALSCAPCCFITPGLCFHGSLSGTLSHLA